VLFCGTLVTQDTLLPRSAFVGTAVDTRYTPVTTAGSAWFSGWIVAASAPRIVVEQWLPPDLVLADAARPCTEHPVLVLLGEHAEGAVHWFGVPTRVGPTYAEALILLPYVKHRDGTWLHLFAARMYATFPPAVWSGNRFYGFAKEHAEIRRDAEHGAAITRDGLPRVDLAVQVAAAWTAGPSFVAPQWTAVDSLTRMPVLGRQQHGRLVESVFRWTYEDARIRPVDLRRLVLALVPESEPVSLHPVPGAAFEVERMRWRLGWPSPGRL
jgi:hypothetical protein